MVSIASALVGRDQTAALLEIGASKQAALRDKEPVVVFLPGTLGSILEHGETGEVVWGGRDRFSVNPRTAEGLRALSLPLQNCPPELAAAPDPVKATQLLQRVFMKMLGIRFSHPIYEDALAGFAAAGLNEAAPGVIPANGPSLTPMPFDWRRSIADGAIALGQALSNRPEGAKKVTLLAHSMGAAVAIYYLMYGPTPFRKTHKAPSWEGAKYVDRAIFIAPPFRGSPVAIRNTINGNRVGGRLSPHYPTIMLSTHPSSFELMPHGKAACIEDQDGRMISENVLNSALWEQMGWGLLNPRHQEQLRWLAPDLEDPLALAYERQAALIDRGGKFQKAIEQPLNPPDGLDLLAIIGKGLRTPAGVRVSRGGLIEVSKWSDGDGIVPFESSTAGFEDAAEHPRKTLLTLDASHPRMPSNPAVFNHMLDFLSG